MLRYIAAELNLSLSIDAIDILLAKAITILECDGC